MFLKSQKTRLQLLVIIFVKNNKSYAHSLRHACVTLAVIIVYIYTIYGTLHYELKRGKKSILTGQCTLFASKAKINNF